MRLAKAGHHIFPQSIWREISTYAFFVQTIRHAVQGARVLAMGLEYIIRIEEQEIWPRAWRKCLPVVRISITRHANAEIRKEIKCNF